MKIKRNLETCMGCDMLIFLKDRRDIICGKGLGQFFGVGKDYEKYLGQSLTPEIENGFEDKFVPRMCDNEDYMTLDRLREL